MRRRAASILLYTIYGSPWIFVMSDIRLFANVTVLTSVVLVCLCAHVSRHIFNCAPPTAKWCADQMDISAADGF